jgi:hypothetical protein
LTAETTTGSYVFCVPYAATWTIKSVSGSDSDSETVSITEAAQSKSVTLIYNTIPVFTYSGSYEIVDDSGLTITTTTGNWKIRFLTSGTLNFTDLRGAANGIDLFLVGGGGGTRSAYSAGAGGGYTKTVKNIQIDKGAYEITVGSGGTGTAGGTTSAFGRSAEGGTTGQGEWHRIGGNGGSGGGAYSGATNVAGGQGGSNGGNGAAADEDAGGQGQGSNTREFGETNGALYAGGGAGGSKNGLIATGGAGGGGNSNANGATNTGGGAGGHVGSFAKAGSGGSGIVIIRNARSV